MAYRLSGLNLCNCWLGQIGDLGMKVFDGDKHYDENLGPISLATLCVIRNEELKRFFMTENFLSI